MRGVLHYKKGRLAKARVFLDRHFEEHGWIPRPWAIAARFDLHWRNAAQLVHEWREARGLLGVPVYGNIGRQKRVAK